MRKQIHKSKRYGYVWKQINEQTKISKITWVQEKRIRITYLQRLTQTKRLGRERMIESEKMIEIWNGTSELGFAKKKQGFCLP